jgi:hypothetical protein
MFNDRVDKLRGGAEVKSLANRTAKATVRQPAAMAARGAVHSTIGPS